MSFQRRQAGKKKKGKLREQGWEGDSRTPQGWDPAEGLRCSRGAGLALVLAKTTTKEYEIADTNLFK